MRRSPHRCAVCPATRALTGIIVAGRELFLCNEHAAKLGDERPSSYDDLASFYALPGIDRRAADERRDEDRRMFPRPERRRYNMGRRKDDPEH